MEPMEQRMGRVERELKAWRIAGAVLGTVGLLLGISGLKSSANVQEVVNAKKINVVDANGKTVVWIGSFAGKGAMRVSGPDESAVVIQARDSGSEISLYREHDRMVHITDREMRMTDSAGEAVWKAGTK